MISQFTQDKLVVKKYATRAEMGAGAAADAEKVIAGIIAEKGEINMIFAAAPSQNEMLAGLLSSSVIDWSKVNALHMDEYVGLPEGDSHTFGAYLNEHIFSHKAFKSVHYLGGGEPDAVCTRYTKILTGQKAGQHFILRGCCRKDHIDLTFFCNNTANHFLCILCRCSSHFLPGIILFNQQAIFFPLLHSEIPLSYSEKSAQAFSPMRFSVMKISPS